MPNILSSLSASGNALGVYQKALNVIQNNITNASTPGYARQQLVITAQPLNLADGLIGGIAGKGLQSSSDAYANAEVQRQMQTLGFYTAQSQSTSTIESQMDISGSSGISGSIDNLFKSFSAWSVSPGDPISGNAVISAAGSLAVNIRSLSNSLTATSNRMDAQLQSTVSQINGIATQIQQYNVQRLKSPTPDPGEEAQLESNLESLSQLVNFTTLTQSDGTVTVLAGGSSPLVIGKQMNALSSGVAVNLDPDSPNPSSPPSAQILDAQGNDITSELMGGRIGGLLDTRNRVLGSILGDARQAGSLNTLAKSMADTINGILQSGKTSTAPGTVAGAPLFSYDTTGATSAAGTLIVSPSITYDQLAPVDAAGNSNGNAILLAGLANATTGQGTIDGASYGGFYARIAASIGAESQAASTNESTQSTVSSQAQALRDQLSGVSLDQEAVSLIQFQRGYQATAKVLTILNDLTDTTLNLIRQ